MRLKVKVLDHVAVLILSGRLGDTELSSSLHNQVKNLIRKKMKKFIIDLEEVESISSHGLGVIIACQTSIANANCQLKLIKLKQPIEQFLKICGLGNFFEIYDSEEEALQSF